MSMYIIFIKVIKYNETIAYCYFEYYKNNNENCV